MNDKEVETLNNQLGRSAMSGPRGGAAASSRGMMPKSLLVKVVLEKTLQTGGSATWIVDVQDLPQLTYFGPMIKQLRVHWECVSATANFRGRMTAAWSVSGRTWSTPVEIFAPQTGAGQAIGAWYTNDANFGVQMQYALEVSNSAGAALESGRLIVYLEIELKS